MSDSSWKIKQLEHKVDRAFEHLINVIALAQTPWASWSQEDDMLFREAREYVQKHRKETREGKGEETGSGIIGESRESQNSKQAPNGVQEERLSLEKGSSKVDGPGE